LVLELNNSGLSYAITGATAASYYGIPRTTADIDFVVRVSARDLPRLTATLEKAGLKVDLRKIRRQFRTEYNVVSFPDKSSQYRADFIFQKGRLQRREGSLLGLRTFYQPPELLILAKLRMIKATIPDEKSLKDKNDIIAILANTKVDLQTIQRSARRESSLELFNNIRRQLKASSRTP